MRTLAHLRWHLAFALGGGLLLGWLDWRAAAVVLAAVADERALLIGASWGGPLRRPARQARRQPAPSRHPVGGTGPVRPRRARWRPPVALAWAPAANCPACRGVGCRACADTGPG